MLLAIDVGNTQTSFGLFRGEELFKHWRISTNKEETGDELAVVLSNLLNTVNLNFNMVSGIVISSVVPHCTQALLNMAEKYFSFAPILVQPGVKTGVSILYENPKEVGADRIANAVAACELVGTPAVVVDFGTATTFDVISAEGEYLGGAIAPGVESAAEALFQKAAQLSWMAWQKPTSVIGRNTGASLQAGFLFGFAGLVDSLISRVEEELKSTVEAVATGGLASLIIPFCRKVSRYEPNLTLVGLKIIYQLNRAE
jgi:type III pantothenate kinase